MSEQPAQVKWYWKTYTLVIIILSAAPLALPLVWYNPRFSRKGKWIWTAVIIVMAYVEYVLTAASFKLFSSQYEQIKQLIE